MRRTSSTSRLGLGTWRATLVALGAAAALGGCGGGETASRTVGVQRQAVTTTTGTVGTATVSTASQHPHQRKAFYAQGRHWVFYSDGANLVFQSSADGAAWAAKTTVRAGTAGLTFGVWFDGTRVHYAYAAAAVNTPLYYRRGTPNADGTIAWTAEEVVAAAASSTTYRNPMVTADANGVPWVGYLRDGNGSTDYPYVTKATAADGTWTTASGFPHQLSTTSKTTWTAVPVALQAGRMLVVYGYATVKLSSKVWTGTAWATARASFSANNVYLDGTRVSAAAQGDDAHLVYLKVSAYAVQHVKWTYSATDTTYYGSWGGETAVQEAVTATSAPVVSLDGATGEAYAFWAGSPTANHLYYKKRSAAGAWDASATDWVNEATEVLTGNDRLTAYAQAAGLTIGVVYSTKTASPYNVKQATLGLGAGAVCGNGVVESGEQCESPFAPCCNPATCQYRTSAEGCRASAGECDLAETCTGASAACPADLKVTAGTECRPVAGGCDVAEACDGASAACPVDAYVMIGTSCRGAVGPCDVAEACTGTSAACPDDAKAAAGTTCRAATDLCDAAEVCDGASTACPADLLAAAGTECRPAAGTCDVAETCTGGTAVCPADVKVAAGTVCRPASGQCDLGATCTGSSATCPTTGLVVAGTACNDGLYCTVADACNGTGACVGAARDCTALGDGQCLVGSCSEALTACVAADDPAGDGNACTTDDVCLPMTGVWYATMNVCELPGAFRATATADGIALAWALPTTPGLTAIEVYRTEPGVTVARPGDQPEARVFAGLGASYLDTAAPGGERVVYTAFAHYGAGAWSAPARASAQRDDRDGDGMADGWEVANGLNPYNPGDAALDPDGDGLTNLQEYVAGTNPLVADTDGDGLTDGEELARGLNPLAQDTDGDGMGDKFELGLGLDPLNGHDFAIGNYAYSPNFRVGAYVVDSGDYRVDAGGQTVRTSERYQAVIASLQQTGPIGVAGAPTGYGYAGYLYSIEEFVAPNYPPQCDAGLHRAVVLPATVQLAGSASDPNGDPLTYSWSFVHVPGLSALTSASLTGATTATPSFTPDVYGYYMLQLAVSDVTGLAGAPCYVVVTALTDQQYAAAEGGAGQFFYTGPFAAVSPSYKAVAVTTAAAGSLALPAPAASPLFRVRGIVADRGPTCSGIATGSAFRLQGQTGNESVGYAATAFGEYDVTSNLAPVAVAGADQTITFATAATLDGSGSHDPDAGPVPLTYQWTLWSRPYGSAASIVNPTAAVATLQPDKAGSYVALLKVYDGELWGVPDPVVVTVANTTPVAKAGPDQYVQLGSPAPTVQLDGAGSYDPEGRPLAYGWRFFRKPAGSVAVLSSTTAVSPTFVADKAGYYHLELVVKDGLLVSAPDYVVVSVGSTTGNLLPIAVVGPSQQLVGVNSTGLDGSGSSDPDWDTVTWPDPDASGVYRRGLGYDWAFLAKPTGSTATIACLTPQSPAWDCPNPRLSFNGYNGTYTIGLRVIDAAAAVSDQVALTVTVSGLVDQPPVAVVMPQHRSIPFSETTSRVTTLDGSASYDPVDPAAVLTYAWSIVEKPSGSTPTLTNPTTATPILAITAEGQYRVHLKVCDAGGKCSCAWGESRAGDAYCNRSSVFTLTTTTTSARVAMPAGWPAAGVAGGSGGTMNLLMGEDGAYDKPVIVVNGFSATEAAAKGDTYQPLNGPFAPIVRTLRAKGYDVWWLTFDPVCSGGAAPNPSAGWQTQTCTQSVANTGACACPYPQQPVDNFVTLNAAVLAYAAKAAKDYGACGSKSADDPTDPCFVRLFGHSMGGLIARTALAWAQDGSQTTVPWAAGETTPFALDGLRAKPAGVTAWDLGVRVAIHGDSSLQGGNVPVSLQAFMKNYEAKAPDSMAAGGMLDGLSMGAGGMGVVVAWAFLKHHGLRDWMIEHRDALANLQEAFAWYNPATQLMLVGLADSLGYFEWAQLESGFLPELFSWIGVVIVVVSMAVDLVATAEVAGWGFAIAKTVVTATLMVLGAVYLGPIGMALGSILGGLLFSVKTSFDMQTLDDSTPEAMAYKLTPVLDSPAAREMLYARVTGYQACPDVPLVLQGYSVPNTYKPGFGKESYGRMCRGAPSIQTSSVEHDRLYGYLKALNGGTGYATNVRNVGLPFGGKTPGIAADNGALMDLYMPYIVSNQRYPTTAWDHLPGSGFGPEVEDQLKTFRLHVKGVLTIKKRSLFSSSTSHRTLFDDRVDFPDEALDAGMGWPYIPTESSSDYTRPAGCGANLPCCQLLADGVTPHPADDGLRNCCQCTTGLDAMVSPRQSLLHVPVMAVSPCLRGTNDDAFLEAMRQACVAPVQAETPGVQMKMCPDDETVYLFTNSYGYACDPAASIYEPAAREAAELLAKALAQLDVRPRCAETQASFVCLDGSASCAPNQGTWVWLGGVDRDGDGCPGPRLRDGTLCATYCETEAQDLDPTVKGAEPQGNHAPVVAAVSGQQSFALPSCWADAVKHEYHCVADVKDGAGTALTVSVTASDVDGDPLRYQWAFLPDAAAGQGAGDVAFSNALAASPRVIVRTSNKAPQGTYALRVYVKDNKGGVAFADTAVAVPGDAPPTVSVSGPAAVPELCEYEANEYDAWRCYADLTLQGTATDPDGPDQTSIILYRWEDLTDRETSVYKAVTTVDDPYLLSPGLEVYASEQHTATTVGYPLRFRLTVVDVRGQSASAEVDVRVCLTTDFACLEP